MRNRYNNHIGKQVGRAVRDAIRSGNLEEVGRTVDNGVQELTNYGNEVLDDLKNAVQRPPCTYAQNRQQGGTPQSGTGGGQPAQSETPSNYQKPIIRSAFRSKMPGAIFGLVYTIIGAFFGIPLLILCISCCIATSFKHISLSNFTIAISIFIPLMVAAFWLMIYGIGLRRRTRRFERYRDVMGGAAFCMVAKLSDMAGETQERTKKDLKKMIACGACPQGHLVRGETCFIVDDQTYDEYLEAEKKYAAQTEAAHAEEQKEQANPKDAELVAIIKEGNGYLQQIRVVNDALQGETISQKLDRLENVAARIFACVRKHPEKLPDIRRFIRYYMPTTLKLVKSYEEFESQPVQGENIIKAKEEIERALDTINTAFENLLDTLFADDALDVSADISTLETMLKQEGLTGSDFAKMPDDSTTSKEKNKL